MKKFEKDGYSNLLAGVANGDQGAFSELYHLFYPSLLQHVILKVNDESVAEDILHDLFLSLWRSRERIQEIESLPAYLYTSSRYLIFEHLKKSSMSVRHNNLADLDIRSDEQPLEDRLYYRYLLDMVNKEIESLPEKCRQIFKLSREEYKSNREIAEYMQISESTVENQIHKALKRIRIVTKDAYYLFSLFL
ncbi:RNA polymerase sigma factor [Mucilaginibacter paludis]|uniref:RNA polymerase, sigma-24 subunit, ECF subfamily n=1 Tax=Mucilaginibacter paludis DSM 18603 TaxID=714943 RepID=H1YE47_9SPHI|nr:RNA polymerase sigma-70 factor [Mucilaginibacter paludis]EHQ25225.1 RNA polymerase, sigma-24 subunit, ECF subfamily [Mucilaginibacter paludis DSM 18603]